ncbi:MAG: DUF1549 domain-containing protein, partial [Acidobacteria bacterium]|nr:DUF1549 domain-containing protein [Acidobacteriota bacterium]
MSWSLLVALGALPLTFAAAAPDFSKDVEPLLRRYCLQCHGEAARMGGLDLRSPSKILKGGAKGPAVLKGSAAGSLLYQRIADQSMPMGPTKVSPKDREVIAAWINAGAPGDEPAAATATTGQKHWAFLPLAAAPAQPQVNAAVWVRSPVDAFTLRAMEQRGIRPARPADDRTLVRRLYLTLTGLPPSPEQAAAPFTDALIDDLLSRPQYGERWARHWLDVVRYAESNGYERDGTKPSAWRYRDWVIDAFNNNKRFDRFIAEQLAGDELEDSNAESQIATTFLRLGVWDDEPADQRMDRYDQLDDVLATTSAAFLGLTLRCARCHDHKFEPFSQKDYTRVLSIFEPLQRPLKGQTELDRQVGTAAELRAYEDAVRAADAEADPLRKLIANLKRGLLERLQSRGEEAQAWQESLPTVLALRVAPERRSAQQAKLAGAFEKKLEVRMLDLATGEERAQLDDWNRRLGEIEGSRPKPPVRAYVWYE